MLDADIYPHLVNLVINLAPRDALLRLRAASKEFRAKADTQLIAGRIIIAAATSAADERTVSSSTNSLARDCLEMPVIVSSPSGRIPAFEGMARGEVFNPAAHDLSRVRIVDLVGVRTLRPEPRRISCTRYDTSLPDACDIFIAPSLDSSRLTVRFMHNLVGERALDSSFVGATRAVAASPDTTVLFTPLPHMFYAEWQAPSLLRWPSAGKVDLRRAVINISVHLDDTRPDEFALCPVSAPEMVLVFHRADTPVVDHASRSAGVDHMLRILGYAVALHIADGHSPTVAGIEIFDGWPGWEPNEGEGVWDGLVRRFRHFCRSTMGRNPRMAGPEALEALSRITFMTLDEFRAYLGPERTAIETMETGWAGKMESIR
ncbi:hypothetical protein CC85DRAFT_285305 [Cutaneotrichosporon oleaginosum]|uniref:Uncharacterized protein n=1 Tax=Cutaneotrichosporon oleaginosum TaxID=879819 RepID=A0A0J0XNX4_9TREE|nr:uncharacterized protein CC85DRAFT_285305 [Cutaneotrichosporon oleaginosum]KLT42767.1 hypothetical protein CC85DRAFT_285305 [Cutaneotrichosporon oleaginosum]TXT09515.1 hypothetical protein COLE_03449 [Cutaneotrichosporon oleaginosum]